MLLALDTTIRQHTIFMNMSFPNGTHVDRLDRLEDELQTVMRQHNLGNNLLGLYRLVADKQVYSDVQTAQIIATGLISLSLSLSLSLPGSRCEDFVMFCEEHRSFSMTEDAVSSENNNSHHYPSCCKKFFHSEPFFTPVGTCFTTKTVVTETSPAIYSSIKIWTTLEKESAPGKNIFTAGMCNLTSMWPY